MKVYKSINAVQAELAREGIGKDRKNDQQGYKFRGIDDVYNALAPMLARNGLCILPRCTDRVCVERTNAKGTALFYVTVRAEFDFVCAEDGSKHTVVTYGEAMDSGDKATNKAMSAAYKYACMQAFSIPTEGDNDADATTHEVKHVSPANQGAHSGPAIAFASLTPDWQAYLTELASEVENVCEQQGPEEARQLVEDRKKSAEMEAEHIAGLWSKLSSKTRAKLKPKDEAYKAGKPGAVHVVA